LLRDKDFKESIPMMFRENFGSLANESSSLNKDPGFARLFARATPKSRNAAGLAPITEAITSRGDGNLATAKLPRHCHQEMTVNQSCALMSQIIH